MFKENIVYTDYITSKTKRVYMYLKAKRAKKYGDKG